MKDRLERDRFGERSVQSSDGRLRRESEKNGVSMKSIPLLCVALFALSALSGCGKSGQASAPPPPQVGVVTVQPTTVALTRDLVGRLSPYLSANVTARVSGVLIKRIYKEGSDVKAGQVLFEIDPTYYQAAVEQRPRHPRRRPGHVSQRQGQRSALPQAAAGRLGFATDGRQRRCAGAQRRGQGQGRPGTRGQREGQSRLYQGDLADQRHRQPAAGYRQAPWWAAAPATPAPAAPC